jgi:hypothetical protein
MMVKNGNCHYSAESGRIVDKKQISIRHDYVMSELILRNDFRDQLGMDLTPVLRA